MRKQWAQGGTNRQTLSAAGAPHRGVRRSADEAELGGARVCSGVRAVGRVGRDVNGLCVSPHVRRAVVHGGAGLRKHVVVDAGVLERLSRER